MMSQLRRWEYKIGERRVEVYQRRLSLCENVLVEIDGSHFRLASRDLPLDSSWLFPAYPFECCTAMRISGQHPEIRAGDVVQMEAVRDEIQYETWPTTNSIKQGDLPFPVNQILSNSGQFDSAIAQSNSR